VIQTSLRLARSLSLQIKCSYQRAVPPPAPTTQTQHIPHTRKPTMLITGSCSDGRSLHRAYDLSYLRRSTSMSRCAHTLIPPCVLLTRPYERPLHPWRTWLLTEYQRNTRWPVASSVSYPSSPEPRRRRRAPYPLTHPPNNPAVRSTNCRARHIGLTCPPPHPNHTSNIRPSPPPVCHHHPRPPRCAPGQPLQDKSSDYSATHMPYQPTTTEHTQQFPNTPEQGRTVSSYRAQHTPPTQHPPLRTPALLTPAQLSPALRMTTSRIPPSQTQTPVFTTKPTPTKALTTYDPTAIRTLHPNDPSYASGL